MDNHNSVNKYLSILNNLTDCIFLMKNEIVLESNNTCIEIFGNIKGESIDRLMQFDKNNALKDFEIIDNVLKGNDTSFEQVFQNKDGEIFDGKISFKQISGFDDFNILVTIKDISDKVNRENELLDLLKKSEEDNRKKSVSLASMSHELRTPLNSIIGFSDLLLDDDTTEDEKELFSKLIQTAGKTLMQLIADIIDISKIEAGQIKIQKSLFNINSFLNDVLVTFRREKESLSKSDIELKLVLSDKAADLQIETDPQRLQQIFYNLLSNSLKFIDEGFIEFGYLTVGKNYIQFYVKDTGVGIENTKREKIFETFGQDKLTYSRNREGSGLGLAISKSFVELLGGKIWLDSEINEGSTFYFTIPLTPKTDTKEYGLSGLELPNKWENKTIVIADDVEENYLFLKGLLIDTAVEINWAKNGKEAVDFCNNKLVDIVLMDIRMPIMDGLEATRLIKKDHPDVFIIAQTAFAAAEDKENCLKAGCDEYFKKPLNHYKLFSVIEKRLNI